MTEKTNLPGEALEKAAAKTLEALGGEIVSGSSNLFGDLLGVTFWDNLKEYRKRRQLDGLAKTAAKLLDMGVNFSKLERIPEYEVYTVFKGFENEADDRVQKLWSNLLAEMLVNKGSKRISNRLTSILKQIDGSDVGLLKALDFIKNKNPISNPFTYDDNDSSSKKVSGVTKEYQTYAKGTVDIVAQMIGFDDNGNPSADAYNILRLGLIAFPKIDASPNQAQLEILNANPRHQDETSMAFSAYFNTFEQNLTNHFQMVLGTSESPHALLRVSEGSHGFPKRITTDAELTGIGRMLLESCPD